MTGRRTAYFAVLGEKANSNDKIIARTYLFKLEATCHALTEPEVV